MLKRSLQPSSQLTKNSRKHDDTIATGQALTTDLLARDTNSKIRRRTSSHSWLPLRAHRFQKNLKARAAHVLIANPALLCYNVRFACEEATDDKSLESDTCCTAPHCEGSSRSRRVALLKHENFVGSWPLRPRVSEKPGARLLDRSVSCHSAEARLNCYRSVDRPLGQLLPLCVRPRKTHGLCDRGFRPSTAWILLRLVRHTVAVGLVKNPPWTTRSKGFKVVKLSKADPWTVPTSETE